MTHKMMLLTLLILASVSSACGDGSADELGSVEMPLVTSTANHTYRIGGSSTIQIYKNGTLQQTVDVGGTETSVLVDGLVPGNYDMFLNLQGGLLKDGAPVAHTLVSTNPHPVTVTAGQTTADVWNFSVQGDPVVFSCTQETCGGVSFAISVTEVPPN